MKRQAAEQKETFAIHAHAKEFYPESVKDKLPNRKMDKTLEQDFHHREHTNGQWTWEQVSILISPLGNANKDTPRSHYTSTRMTKINKMDTIKSWQRCGAPRTLRDCRWECRMVQLLWRSSWQHLLKVNKHLPYSPGILLPGTQPREWSTDVHQRHMQECSQQHYL